MITLDEFREAVARGEYIEQGKDCCDFCGSDNAVIHFESVSDDPSGALVCDNCWYSEVKND